MSEQSPGGSEPISFESSLTWLGMRPNYRNKPKLRVVGKCNHCGETIVFAVYGLAYWEKKAKNFYPRCTNRMCGQKSLLEITVTEQ